MQFKDGVSSSGVVNKIIVAMAKADAVHQILTGKEVTVTSTTEGEHKKSSKHYSGEAFDCRRWDLDASNIPNAVFIFCRMLQLVIGQDFDIVEEEDHVHVEYDPKMRVCDCSKKILAD